MTKTLTQRLIFVMMVTAIFPFTSFGNDRCIKRFHDLSVPYKIGTVSDTIPPTIKPEEDAPAKTKPDIIKEVPKSRRQVKPVVVPKVPVKPIKIIKPKIIRRAIGIIG